MNKMQILGIGSEEYEVMDCKARPTLTVETMKLIPNLEIGDVIKTLGYSAVNDGGSAYYLITDEEISGRNVIALTNGLKAKLIETETLNVKCLGITGNESSDSTDVLKELATFLTNSKVKKLVFNTETYNVNDYIEFVINQTNFEVDFNGALIKMTNSFDYSRYGILTFTMNETINSKLTLVNGFFDGSGNEPNFSPTNIHPIGGSGAIKINGSKEIIADNLHFNDWFYSACICAKQANRIKISNCTGVNVGGRSADNTVDDSGDALYFSQLGVVYENDGTTVDPVNSTEAHVEISNCSFKSYEAIENPNTDENIRNGCQSGRAGVVFGEYSQTGKNKYLTIKNSYFYNYQKVIHCEKVDEVNILCENTTFENNGSILLTSDTTMHNAKFHNCYIDKNVNVIGLYKQYDFLFTGEPITLNNTDNLLFDNCSIKGYAGKLILLGESININFSNCIIEVEELTYHNANIKFNHCDIKANRTNEYASIKSLNNCKVELGYKHDTNSRYYFNSNESVDYIGEDNISIIKDSLFINVGIYPRSTSKIFIVNNVFNYDDNFIGKDNYEGELPFLMCFHSWGLKEFCHNVVNNNSTLQSLMGLGNGHGHEEDKFNISFNRLNNVKLDLYEYKGFNIRVNHNKLSTDRNLNRGLDFYEAQIIAHDNIIEGYTTPTYNISKSKLYNNFTLADSVLTEIQ